MKIAYITAGAANMFCGSCLHDNTLAASLIAQGHEALLIPTYTPIRTDEPDVSLHRVFFGGVNVYLQQNLSIFRHTPWILDRLFDGRGLLRWVSRFAAKTQANHLGGLLISMLKGEHGHQCKEVAKLVSWLASDVRPEIVNLTNVLLSGLIHEIKRQLGVPVLCTLQGDDIFLEALPLPYRREALKLIRDHCLEVDGFIATSNDYADFMAEYLDIPRPKIHVVYPGLNLAGHGKSRDFLNGNSPVIGYFARICPEKGFHLLASAFSILRQMPEAPRARFRASGWLGENDKDYFQKIQKEMERKGLADSFEYVVSPDHHSKVDFLQSIDVFSVPTTYREPKGLYVLEALANALPVVQPRHGSFPELVEATGGGILVNPNDPHDLAQGLLELLTNPTKSQELGRKGQEAVRQHFTADVMAKKTVDVYRLYCTQN